MIDFLFSVGPRYEVGEIARIALVDEGITDEDNIWNNFGDEQWRSLYLSYTLTESLFQWTNVMALLLQVIPTPSLTPVPLMHASPLPQSSSELISECVVSWRFTVDSAAFDFILLVL